jgi:hypothetical protein
MNKIFETQEEACFYSSKFNKQFEDISIKSANS